MNKTQLKTRCRDMLVMAAAMGVALAVSLQFCVIGMPSQTFSGCLTYSVFFVSHLDKEIHTGALYAVQVTDKMLNAKPGDRLIKIVAAKGGDTVTVTPEGVRVAGRFYPDPLRGIAGRLGIPMSQLTKTIVVPPGQVFLVGNTDHSYDSRFWGPVDESKIIGRAAVLL